MIEKYTEKREKKMFKQDTTARKRMRRPKKENRNESPDNKMDKTERN
jgi:hypothetical protein